MKNFQNADFINNDNAQESTNSLSKSADMLSTRDLILSLNDSFITGKSKEYNFDFSKESSYDSNQTLSFLNQQSCFCLDMHEKPEELKLIARKTASNLIKNSSSDDSSHLNNNKNCFSDAKNNNHKNNLDSDDNNIFGSNSNKNSQNNFNNELKSKQNFSNFTRKPNDDSIRRLKQRLQSLQQKKKFVFFEAKNQNQELNKDIKLDDKPNIYFE